MPTPELEMLLGSKREQLSANIESGKVAFIKFSEFIAAMKLKYANTEYKDEFPKAALVNILDPSINVGLEDSLRSIVAMTGDKVCGIILGEVKGYTLQGDWYIIDPEYQNSEIRNLLIDLAKSKFKKITLVASATGEPTIKEDDSNYMDTLRKKKISRQQALIKLYEKLGFKKNTNSSLYKHHVEPYDPMPMIWEEVKAD